MRCSFGRKKEEKKKEKKVGSLVITLFLPFGINGIHKLFVLIITTQ